MKKLLYIDTPFLDGFGGDKNRSRFLYKSLKTKYDTDALLITDGKKKTGGFKTIQPAKPVFSKPQSVYCFDDFEVEKFRQMLIAGKYDIIFIRFCSPAVLADIASDILPSAKIIVDVDMLLSRISVLSWKMSRTIKNRFYLFESIKLKLFERRFFKEPYLFLFSNPLERDMVKTAIKPISGKLEIVPNIMEASSVLPQTEQREKYILFFGALGSAANKDAFRNLAENIYGKIDKTLKDNNIKLKVVGKGIDDEYWQLKERFGLDNIDLVGEVEDINEQIAGSLFVVLPLRVGSGTRTRILEAAAMGKVVVTTTIGVEGLDFTKDEIVVEDDSEGFASQIQRLLKEPRALEEMSCCFEQKCRALYAAEVVSDNLIRRIDEYMPKKLNIAIATNRFYPEVGGAETNIFFQARRLSKQADVTVFCPKRIDAPSSERLEGFNLKRLKDFLNLRNKFPNIKTKTFTPSLFFKILFGNFDIVMCFPALSFNNILAFIACKLKRKPVVLCCFDWLDYSAIMHAEGKIDVDMLARHKPRKYREFFLRRFDYIFAISNKEIEFFKQYNKNVGYSPVPILLDEYQKEVSCPRSKYGISDSEFVFLSLGRVSKIKGQDLAGAAFAKVAEKMPDAKLAIVGRCDYDPDIKKGIEKIAKEKGIIDRVIFTGMIERDEVLGWLRTSDIHVIPVRFMNSGAVVVESWISHTPVLQSNVVDPNLVKDGETGYLFKSKDVDDLAEKMLTAYRNRANLKQMGASGEQLVKQKYTYEYLTKLYLETFEKLIKG